jgi:hypothetical protein
MGADPTAAARWIGYCPRRSRTRVEALLSIRRRAISRFFLDATKWRADCSQSVSVRHYNISNSRWIHLLGHCYLRADPVRFNEAITAWEDEIRATCSLH